MYSLQIRFKLLNKSCNRQELSDNLNIGSISIMSDEQSPFSVIIQGYRSEEEAQKPLTKSEPEMLLFLRKVPRKIRLFRFQEICPMILSLLRNIIRKTLTH